MVIHNIDSSLRSLGFTVAALENHRLKIEWLLGIGKEYDSIVNFGCSTGNEALALMWILNANQVVGIDKDSNNIDQAQNLPINIQQDIQNIQLALQYNQLSNDIHSQLQSYVEKFRGFGFPKFMVGDMTKTTDLSSDYFDLAFCERVLYHIVCDSKGIDDNILSAIQEMARVVKSGGIVIAIEPNTCSFEDDTPVRLKPFFEQVGLLPIKIGDVKIAQGDKTIYAYSKPRK